MDYSNFPTRVEPADQTGVSPLRQASKVLSTKAETTRPVLAAAQADSGGAVASTPFEPLDTFAVGDNDHVPVPPEPPREATVLAIMANAQEVQAEQDALEVAPEPTDAPAQTDGEEAVVDATEPREPQETPPQPQPLTDALRTIDAGPKNPTVDIRS